MKSRSQRLRFSRTAIALGAMVALGAPLLSHATESSFSFWHRHAIGAVYSQTNAASGNQIVSFDRMSDGSLHQRHAVATGGTGNDKGGGLGNQDAVVLSKSGDWLLAVNAGSNSVSTFLVLGNYLLRTSTVHSGGRMPVSIALRDNVAYVLNAGSDNLQGFTLGVDGRLERMSNATQSLSGSGVGAADVLFNGSGDLLAVTEKATGKVLTFDVDGDGRLGPVSVHNSPAPTPFGATFGRRDHLLVSEAVGGAAGKSSLSSYNVKADGSAQVTSGAVPSRQSAACWVVATRDGRYAYTSNTGSNNVSAYAVAPNGKLTLLSAVAGGTGAVPIDLALSRNSDFLYALNSGTGSISAFAVNKDGSLRALGQQKASKLGLAATGLVAR